MKTFRIVPLTFLGLLIIFEASCSLPARTYHSAKAASRRSHAISRGEIASHVKVSARMSELFNTFTHEQVVVLARDTRDSGKAVGGIEPEERHIAESILIQGLLSKGYRGATRLSLRPVTEEMLFPFGQLNGEVLRQLFKGSMLCVCTVTKIEMQPESYVWQGFFSGDKEKKTVGTRVNLYLSMELVDAKSSETLFIASAEIDEVLRDENVARGVLLTETLRKVVEKLPSRKTNEIETVHTRR